MAFLGFFKRRGETQVKTTPRARYPDRAVAEFGLRRGMWVTDARGRTGILTGVDQRGVASIMLVREDGTNLVEVQESGLADAQRGIRVSALRQATRNEIPKSRRPSAAVASEFGYL